MARAKWTHTLEVARRIVEESELPITLRQLHYLLVSDPTVDYQNTQTSYKELSSRTAEGRRDGWFPDLLDNSRQVHVPTTWASPEQVIEAVLAQYRVDRTIGQDVTLVLGVEKRTMVEQLSAWYSDLGLPILALGGYSSQTYISTVQDLVEQHDRPAVLLYCGDFDPSGEDIDRDFVARTDCWAKVIRVALTREQVIDLDLPLSMGKSTDSRARKFVERHGDLVQVELEALPLPALRQMLDAEIGNWWDANAYDMALAVEQSDLDRLNQLTTR